MGVTQLGSLKKEVNGVLKENDMLEDELPGSGVMLRPRTGEQVHFGTKKNCCFDVMVESSLSPAENVASQLGVV